MAVTTHVCHHHARKQEKSENRGVRPNIELRDENMMGLINKYEIRAECVVFARATRIMDASEFDMT